jgi:exopolysaccharide biosynthesis predicted pyruvyltransferase EpsI
MDHAVIVVDNPSIDNGDGYLWFPRKNFLTNIPEISVMTPQTVRNFTDTKEIPALGYLIDPIRE